MTIYILLLHAACSYQVPASYIMLCVCYSSKVQSVLNVSSLEELHIVSNIQYVHIYPIYIIKYKRDIQYIQYIYIYINIIKGTSENIMVSK